MVYTQPVYFWGNPMLTIIIDITPILVLFILLAGLKQTAWKAVLISSVLTFLLAVLVGAPLDQTGYVWLMGALFGFWYISWLIFWGITWFNTWRLAGYFDAFTSWLLRNIVNDIRVLSIALAWSLGSLIEGLMGFGTPWAYVVPILVSLGLPSLRAITLVAVADTAPVSYGAFGIPIITLAGVTGLPLMFMSSVSAHIVAVLAFLITFILLYIIDGWRGIREVWPIGLVGATGYVIGQYTTAVYMGPYLPDVIGSILSFIFIILFSKVWKPRNIIKPTTIKINNIQDKGVVLRAWISLAMFVAILGLWNSPISPMKLNLVTFSASAYSEVLKKSVSISYVFNLLATGTSILVAWLLTIPIMGASREVVVKALKTTVSQTWGAVLTGVFALSLGFVFNFSGMAYSLAYLASGLGILFVLISPFLGWLGAALTGSNTSSNALFGPFQAAMGTLLGIPQGFFPGLQTVGAEIGKPVAPQTVSAGLSTTEYVRKEGVVIRNNLKYSIGLVFLLLLIGILYLILYPYPFILHGK